MVDKCKVFVGNLPYDVAEEDLYDLFADKGKVAVAQASVITDRETGRSRGFGFVLFENEEDAQEAIKKSNTEVPEYTINGRQVTVSEARSKQGGGRGGGGRFRGGYGGGRDRGYESNYGGGRRERDYDGGYGGGRDRDYDGGRDRGYGGGYRSGGGNRGRW